MTEESILTLFKLLSFIIYLLFIYAHITLLHNLSMSKKVFNRYNQDNYCKNDVVGCPVNIPKYTILRATFDNKAFMLYQGFQNKYMS